MRQLDTSVEERLNDDPVIASSESAGDSLSEIQPASDADHRFVAGIVYKCGTCDLDFPEMLQLEKHIQGHSTIAIHTTERLVVYKQTIYSRV